ncbi:hypothetical protein CARUB_v10003313mg [Capsella rubella]|uniref:Prolamin-like domain-containing protein n=2 Tax=Capsella rubella TaxID=81985 RepID=R0HFT4_9BRAS|nr:hypothetical protein CARUB_v10003313mg [Capsella rubella]
MIKVVLFMGCLLSTILISSANPNLATKSDDDDETWIIDPSTDLNMVFAESPTSREYNEDVLNKESSEHFDYLLNCSEKRGRECNEEVMEEILQNRNVSDRCCEKIVSVGKDCHVGIANVMFKNYHVRRFASRSVFKASKVWNRCYAQSDAAHTPYSG